MHRRRAAAARQLPGAITPTDNTASPAVAQFARFPDLPQELQDLIWRQAAVGCISFPGYIAECRFRSHDEATDPNGSIIQLHHVDAADGNTIHPISALSAMLFTCRQSSAWAATVFRAYSTTRPRPFYLYGLRHPINADRNVVILHGEWFSRMHFHFSIGFNGRPLLPLRSLGIQLPDYVFQTDGNYRSCVSIAQLCGGAQQLPLWTRLKNLYLIVDPRYLRCGSEWGEERLRRMAQVGVLFQCGNRAIIPLDCNMLDESDHQLREAVTLCQDIDRHYRQLAVPSQQGAAGRRLARCLLVTWRPSSRLEPLTH